MVEEKKFRQDLLFRINTIELHLPPLRERTADIELLAYHFLNALNKKYAKKITVISQQAIKALNTYEWPGNIRELEHIIERAVIISEDNQIGLNDLHFTTKVLKPETNISLNLEDTEKALIVQALNQYHGNVSKAAKALGLTRTSLYRRMEKYNL